MRGVLVLHGVLRPDQIAALTDAVTALRLPQPAGDLGSQRINDLLLQGWSRRPGRKPALV